MKWLVFVGILAGTVAQAQPMAHTQPVVGADRMEVYLPLLEGRRVALVVNHTAQVGPAHLVDTLLRWGVHVTAIFAPEHGFRGSAEAGEDIHDGHDVRTGVPVVSIYGKKKKPSAADLAGVDVVVFDIQDVGARFFTYISTLYYVAEACAEQHKRLIVLDRPNPNGHYVDGPLLEPEHCSFIGMVPVPVVHGCTVGELAQMFRGEGWINLAQCLDLEVIACENYTHDTRYTLPVKPSPNLPDQRSVLLYPTICLFEGTKVSVGRGTDTPFQRFGYPGFPKGDIEFVPCPNAGAATPLHMGKFCAGFDVSDVSLDFLYERPGLDVSLLLYFFEHSPRQDDFFLSNGFFTLLAGTKKLREQVEVGCTEAEIKESWAPDLALYRKMRAKYLLYPD
jgi:uncharacterized protein YbbC (DUF1343 family)